MTSVAMLAYLLMSFALLGSPPAVSSLMAPPVAGWGVMVMGADLVERPGTPPPRSGPGHDLRRFASETGRCPCGVKHCVGIALHVVVEGGGPVQTPRWFADQLSVANRLFAEVEVGFEVATVLPKSESFADLQTRRQRDLLGRKDHSTGVAHVYLVRRLADVDIAGEVIRGVHWRDRANRQRRWVILSSIGSKMVLAHELGHFFGLPHSRYDVSIMNKTPRDLPWTERVFAKPEIAKMRRRRDQMLNDATLAPR